MSFRKNLLRVHRWCGIILAAFLVLAGATGSLLAFHHEIEAALVPELFRVEAREGRASLDAIAARVESRHPELVVGYFLFAPEPGATIRLVMNTRRAAEEGRLDRDAAVPSEIFADPYTGEIRGERTWGETGLSRAHLVPMVYRLHMSLLLGEAGQWITALVAAAWIATL
ncbi:MAG: PepSY domain-containing protein, partial [Burkholderiales bacterium]|nr:PepSY domain-containing protein [Burkholderiales bacterium]